MTNSIPLFVIRIYTDISGIPLGNGMNIWNNESRSWGSITKMWGKACFCLLDKHHEEALWCVDKHPCSNVVAIITTDRICLYQSNRNICFQKEQILYESIYHFIPFNNAYEELEKAVLVANIHVA